MASYIYKYLTYVPCPFAFCPLQQITQSIQAAVKSHNLAIPIPVVNTYIHIINSQSGTGRYIKGTTNQLFTLTIIDLEVGSFKLGSAGLLAGLSAVAYYLYQLSTIGMVRKL